jgi:hypothetical protein
MKKQELKLKWKKEVKNSFYRGSDEKYTANLCGFELNLLYHTDTHPFCWSLDCKELGFDNMLLSRDYNEAVERAEDYLKWKLEKWSKIYHRALEKLTSTPKRKRR